jgi:hypothetical protein
MSDEQEGVPLLVISRDNAEHYSWGTGCDGWHLVRESGLSVIEECMPACASEVAHYHRKSRQFFFIWFHHSSVLAIMGFETPKSFRPIPLSADRRFRVDESTPTAGH